MLDESTEIPDWHVQAPLFTVKSKLFAKSTFVIGYDTAIRLIMPKYYGRWVPWCGYNDFTLSRLEYALESMLGVGTPALLYPGLSMPWNPCCACCSNIMQLGCRLIAWWLCWPPWSRLPDSHGCALWP